MKVYRGACTVKDWSNTTACPIQWCDKGEYPRLTVRFLPDAQLSLLITTAADSFFPVLVFPSGAMDIWQCPPVNNGPVRWWCGDTSVTPACQSGDSASFYILTNASELGFPPMTFSQSVATRDLSDLVTNIFSSGTTNSKATIVPASSPAKTYTDASVPAQTPEHSANLTTAIGVGVGVPLGIAAIGFLGFLFWRATERKHKNKSRILNQEHALGDSDQSAKLVNDRQWTELPDAQLPRELDDTGKRELPSM